MSAQPAIVPTSRPRWTPVVVPGPTSTLVDGGPGDVDIAPVTAATADQAAVTGTPSPRGTARTAGAVRGPAGRRTVVDRSADVRRLAPPTRAAAWRRRSAVVAIPAAIALLLAVVSGGGTADAELADPVAGTVTVAPGETLWDVAAATAPDGTDTRDQLGRIIELNGFDRDQIDPWTVVLIPVR